MQCLKLSEIITYYLNSGNIELIILASSSASRNAQLQRLKIPFSAQPPDINEVSLKNESIEALTKRLSYEKALKIAQLKPNNLIIGGDQMAISNGQLLGKPLTYQKAVEQLKPLSQQSLIFYTSICVMCANTQFLKEHTEKIVVKFKKLNAKIIENYLKLEKPFHCCASFKSEGLGLALVDEIRSNDPSAIIGLPLIQLLKFIDLAGYKTL